MKQLKKILLFLLPLFLLCGCVKLTTYKEVSYKTVKKKIENKESFILYIASSECSACAMFKPTLEMVIKDYQIKVSYLNIIKMSKEEVSEFENIINFEGSTPKVYFIKDGEYSQYNAIKGAQDYDYVVSKMKANGYIK